MQYSSNSDAAMRSLIRARPTLIGQFRQANLELFRRQQDLQAVGFQLRKDEQNLRIAQIEVEEMAITCGMLGARSNGEKIECQRKLAEITAEEMALKLQTTSELAADTKRELRVCVSELERIVLEGQALLGVNLELLDEAQFQALMAEEFKAKRSRYFAAQFLAPQLGVSAGALEELLEIPEDDRAEIMQLQTAYIQGFVAASPQPTQQLPQ